MNNNLKTLTNDELIELLKKTDEDCINKQEVSKSRAEKLFEIIKEIVKRDISLSGMMLDKDVAEYYNTLQQRKEKNREKKIKVIIICIVGIIVLGLLYSVNHFLIESWGKNKIEEAIKINNQKTEKTKQLFQNGEDLYCQSAFYRLKINKNEWALGTDKFENNKGQFFYIDECRK